MRGQCLDGSRPSQREKRTGRSPPRCKGTAAAPAPSLLLLRGDGRDRSSGVYRCPGRQLGVLRFALRETVPFSVFRLLTLRTRRSRYRISRALAFVPAHEPLRSRDIISVSPRREYLHPSRTDDLNPAVYSPGDVSSLIIKIYFYFKEKN